MRRVETLPTIQDKTDLDLIFMLFGIWSFIALCRPQDYLPLFAQIRPSLIFGLVTYIVYILHAQTCKSTYKSEQFKHFLLFIIVMVIGVPFSYYRSASLADVLHYMTITLIFFHLLYQVGKSEEKLRSLIFAYCCGASIYAIYTLNFGKLAGSRITFGSMFDPNDTAFFVLNFIAFNFLFLAKGNNVFKKLIAAINILSCLLVLFKTGSRGGFVSCIVLFVYLFFIKTKTVNISLFKKAVVVFLAFTSLWIFSMNTERYKSILEVTTDYNITGEQGRVALWKSGIKMMLLNPLTGVGMGRFPEGIGRDRLDRGLPSTRWQTAHNSFVQIGAELGVIGLILYILMTFKVFTITGRIMEKSLSEDLVKISEMVRIGFLCHVVCAMFLSQAYSIYWIFYIALSATLQRIFEEEQNPI